MTILETIGLIHVVFYAAFGLFVLGRAAYLHLKSEYTWQKPIAADIAKEILNTPIKYSVKTSELLSK